MLAVVRTGRDAYGMNVRRELEDVTGRDVTIGSVYATLDRLEAKGLLTSSRIAAQADVPSRRIFAASTAGLQSLLLTRATRDRLWSGITLDRFVHTCVNSE